MADAAEGWWAPIIARMRSNPAARAATAGARVSKRHRVPPRRVSPTANDDGDLVAPSPRAASAAAGNRRTLEYSPDDDDAEWVRRVSFDGCALAIRREQERFLPKGTLGNRPMRCPPRAYKEFKEETKANMLGDGRSAPVQPFSWPSSHLAEKLQPRPSAPAAPIRTADTTNK